jgi:hypothetical protein
MTTCAGFLAGFRVCRIQRRNSLMDGELRAVCGVCGVLRQSYAWAEDLRRLGLELHRGEYGLPPNPANPANHPLSTEKAEVMASRGLPSKPRNQASLPVGPSSVEAELLLRQTIAAQGRQPRGTNAWRSAASILMV